MSIHGLLFQWVSTVKIQLSVLVLYKAEIIIISSNVTCSRHFHLLFFLWHFLYSASVLVLQLVSVVVSVSSVFKKFSIQLFCFFLNSSFVFVLFAYPDWCFFCLPPDITAKWSPKVKKIQDMWRIHWKNDTPAVWYVLGYA